MRYLRKFVLRVGLVSTLLIGGVLGGLMAPLPSEALPPTLTTLTIKIDGIELSHSSGSFLNTASSTCAPSDVTLGYNFCYAINTSTTVFYNSAQVKVPAGTGTLQPVRQYKIVNYTGTVARLRLSDKNGQDGVSLAGMVIAPVLTNWTTLANNTDEAHTFEIIITTKLDATTDPTSTPTPNAAINVNNAGNYVWAMRTAGEFNAQPVFPATNPAVNCNVSASNNDGHCDAIGDVTTFAGKGTFSTANTNVSVVRPAGSANNTQTMSFTVQGPHSNPDVHWDGLNNSDMGQVNLTYPSFDCRNDYGGGDPTKCTPTLTLTQTAATKGPDKLTVLNGSEAFCARCSEVFTPKDTKRINFLTALRNVLTFIRPFIIDKPQILAKVDLGITLINLSLTASAQPPTVCPDGGGTGQGAAIVATKMAQGAAIDLRITAFDGSAVGEPAPLHYYAVISNPGVNWQTAKGVAENIREDCHLATITSESEQAIINIMLPNPTSFPPEPAQQYWIGGEQQSGAYEPGGNWQWINGEGPFWNSSQSDGQNGAIPDKYQNWGNTIPPGLQPDNVCNDSGCQNHLALDHRYGWRWDDNDQFLNNVILGYITEGTAGQCLPAVIN